MVRLVVEAALAKQVSVSSELVAVTAYCFVKSEGDADHDTVALPGVSSLTAPTPEGAAGNEG